MQNWSRGRAEKTGRKDGPGLERVSAMPRGKGKRAAFESSRHRKLGDLDCRPERSPGETTREDCIEGRQAGNPVTQNTHGCRQSH